MKKQVSVRKVSAKHKTRVIPLASRPALKGVTSIGFRCSGIERAESLKFSFSELKEILGGKAAGLVQMSQLGVSIPPALNLSTSLCNVYLRTHRLPESVVLQMKRGLQGLGKSLGLQLGSADAPLLLSVRSGARVSMPGMMDTILNIGLSTQLVNELSSRSPAQARFWWDCYRRLIRMYADVVLGFDPSPFDQLLEDAKNSEGITQDSQLSAPSLQGVVTKSLEILKSEKKDFPQDPWLQVMGATEAVFRSWNTDRAVHYRQLNQYSEDWGTAVTIQAMVFGNRNDQSGTGVVFTRDPSTGEKRLYGEYLMNAQGEDVVAGIRTPQPIEFLKKASPKVFAQLTKTLARLENHFQDAQDVEFTIDDERLFILQTRTAKRTARAALEHARQFVKEGKLSKAEALKRVSYDQVRQLLHPTLVPHGETSLGCGLPASPGAASGRVALSPETAIQFSRAGQKVILVRRETSPEDIMGMSVSEGILTATGGMTSHAAVVARGMGKACVVGCGDLNFDEKAGTLSLHGQTLTEGDLITLNGSTGDIYRGELLMAPSEWGVSASEFFGWTDRLSSTLVFANADTPEQAKQARAWGARGIGLCRTEHMFFDSSRLKKFRRMILSDSAEKRAETSMTLLEDQRDDFIGLFKAMDGYAVTVRLLDPPLHEFLPSLESKSEVSEIAQEMQMSVLKLEQRLFTLREANPMLGHRGCRLGVTFPEIYEMQIRALAAAFWSHNAEGGKASLKIMIPLTMATSELEWLLTRLKKVWMEAYPKTPSKTKGRVAWGTMIELPRACMIAKELAPIIDFISFGTNDLTQTTFGISRDDATKFIPDYLDKKLLRLDPFETLDRSGVGRLIEIAVSEARAANSAIEVGVCGEHGGDPESIPFFEELGFTSVSCSPFRVPLARLALARSALDRKTVKRKNKK
jgi:pyruvate,orthophosphate dikinase